MKKAVCEPWDNGYVLASSSRELLERLARGPQTKDQVLRSCILENELVDLVDPATSREMQTGMLWMLIRVIVTLGRRPPPEKTVRKVEKLVERARADLNWKTVPSDLRDRAERRAEFLTDHCLSRGWIDRSESGNRWALTDRGNKALEEGAFNIR
jgi:hypothetical protein